MAGKADIGGGQRQHGKDGSGDSRPRPRRRADPRATRVSSLSALPFSYGWKEPMVSPRPRLAAVEEHWKAFLIIDDSGSQPSCPRAAGLLSGGRRRCRAGRDRGRSLRRCGGGPARRRAAGRRGAPADRGAAARPWTAPGRPPAAMAAPAPLVARHRRHGGARGGEERADPRASCARSWTASPAARCAPPPPGWCLPTAIRRRA